VNVFAQGLGQRSEQVLRALRGEIERGVYTRGERLPTEKQLCERFAASRPTIRRAIARLVDEGKVRVRRGSGMYVCFEADAPPPSQTLSMMYNFDGADLTYAQDYALSHGYLLCVFSQARDHWDVAAERKFLQRVLRENHRGLVAYCSPVEPRNDDLLAELDESGVRVIHIEHYRGKLPDQEYVLPDYHKAGHMGAVSMMLAGYESLVFVACNVTSPYSALMEQGFAEALAEHREGYEPARHRFVFPMGWGIEPVADRQVRRFIEGLGKSVGLVCESAGVSSHLLGAMRAAGRRVPEEVGLVGVVLVGRLDREVTTDTIHFDRMAILRRALDGTARAQPGRVRELLAPQWTRAGTARENCSAGPALAGRCAEPKEKKR